MTQAAPNPSALQLARRAGAARNVLLAFGALALGTWVAVAIGAIRKDPGLGGWMAGILGGFFVGMLVAGVGAWVAIRVAVPPAPKEADSDARDGADPVLAKLLTELEATRQDTIREINRRASWRMPACAAAGLVVWVLGQFSNDPGDTEDLIALIIVPGLMGYVWASLKLSNDYAKLYKAKVLPALAKSFGDLDYRRALLPDMALLKAENIFRDRADATADDEIFGTHRGLKLNIVELKLERHSGKNTQIVFDGLVVTIELPRDTNATTAIVADGGMFGNLRDRMIANGRQRVRLEDPVFERVYEVYGTDQIAARALLHPAFMEKLLKLSERPDFDRPLALCVGRQLMLAMPKRSARNLFEAPSVFKPATSRIALASLRADIAAVLAAADAVIDLDPHFSPPIAQPGGSGTR